MDIARRSWWDVEMKWIMYSKRTHTEKSDGWRPHLSVCLWWRRKEEVACAFWGRRWWARALLCQGGKRRASDQLFVSASCLPPRCVTLPTRAEKQQSKDVLRFVSAWGAISDAGRLAPGGPGCGVRWGGAVWWHSDNKPPSFMETQFCTFWI